MANIITSCRILCSIVLLLPPAFSPWFYILYLFNGLTDMIDGAVARKSGSVSEFGSKLDTVADFIFVVACLIKLLPAIDIPTWLLIWIVLIAVIKIINVVSGFIYCKRFVAVHTVMNKVAGLLLFMLPLTLSFIEIKYSAIFVCGAATFAAIQEGHFIRTGRIVE
jgi:phosphatidylglycerophosphate synthase